MNQRTLVETKTVILFSGTNPFRFECGATIPEVTIAYETYGKLNSAGDNAILICHALTGSAHAGFYHTPEDKVAGWWDGFVGHGCPLDPQKYFIISPNILSGCYGTTGPDSIDPRTGQKYKMTFPPTTTRDMVNANKALLDYLGVTRLKCVVGGSLGAMQVWEWVVQFPDFMELAIPIAGTTQGSPWMTALNEVARQAIFNDPNWCNGNYDNPVPAAGLHVARMLGMISYRTPEQFEERFRRERVNPSPEAALDFDNWFQVESYLHYQGDKLVKRFDTRSYVYLSEAMDLQDISRGFSSLEEALNRIQTKMLVIGLSSDLLYLPYELIRTVEQLKALGKNARYAEISTKFGHDAFLIEYDKLNPIVTEFLEQQV